MPWRRIRRWLRPPRLLRPTRAGWCFFGITFCVGFAALNTGNNLLYLVLSLMLAFLILSGVLSESALRGIELRRRLPGEAFAGADAPVQVEVRNAQARVPSFALVIEDRLAPEQPDAPLDKAPVLGQAFVLRAGPGEVVHRRYALRADRRGALRFGGFRVATRFPFGLFTKIRDIPALDELLVFPAIDPARAASARRPSDDSGEAHASHSAGGDEVAGVRDYGAGDALRRVHWRSSLRRGALVVRELEDATDARAEVRLQTAGEQPGARFEAAVSRAASQVVAHLQEGLAVGLRTDDATLEPGRGARHRARLLSLLARVEPGARTPAADAGAAVSPRAA